MMIERKILEALDASRPATDDLHSADHPELAEAAALVNSDSHVQEVHARVQQFDVQIQDAMEAVELPAGLAARMKARLAAGTSVSPAAVSPAAVAEAINQVPAEPSVALAQPTAGVVLAHESRRHWLATALATIAASLVVTLGMWQFWPAVEVELTREELRSLSKEWHASVQDSAAWRTDVASAPADHPFPADALLARVQGFQPLALPGDRHAVAYNVTYRGQRATVIVYRAAAPGLDLVPPRSPFNTQNVCVGLWQRNGLLFALVVEGSPATYRQLLQSNQGTLG